MSLSPVVIDHHALAGIAFAGDVLGTLGSLYLTDELLRRQYRLLSGITAFLTFGIPLSVGFGIVGGIIPAILAGALNGIWMALRVMEVLPGGYSFSGVFQWAFAYGLVASLTHSPDIGLLATLASIVAGSIRYVIARRNHEAAVLLLMKSRRQILVGALLVLVTGALMVAASILFQEQRLFTDPFNSSPMTIVAVAAAVGWFGSAGPSIVRWAKQLPAGGLGAIGLTCILLGFVAQALTTLPSLLDITVR